MQDVFISLFVHRFKTALNRALEVISDQHSRTRWNSALGDGKLFAVWFQMTCMEGFHQSCFTVNASIILVFLR